MNYYLVTYENYMGDHSIESDKLISSKEPISYDEIVNGFIKITGYREVKILKIEIYRAEEIK